MKSAIVVAGLMLGWLMAGTALAVDYRVEEVDEAPPADAVGEEIAQELSPTALRVVRGKSTPHCDIWLRKSWPVRDDFTPSLSELYPFHVGELLGVVRYHRSGEDFRAQEIPEGVYTLRYALQPVDGNHIGTSDTRDFMLLLPAADDQELADLDESRLWELSATSVGTSHPAMLSLLSAGDEADELPSIAHNEEFDQWSITFGSQAEAGGDTKELVVRLVVVGHSPE